MRHAVVAMLVLSSVLVAGCLAEPRASEADPDVLGMVGAVAGSPVVRFETSAGAIGLIVYEPLMPGHGGRFLELVDADFYDGTQVHRIVDDFVIQGGDPTGTGAGGSGTTIAHERHASLPFGAGALGMARDQDPDSGDSQWFITERPVLRLSDPDSETSRAWGTFAMFGQVVAGMEVVRAIAAHPTLRDPPDTPVPIVGDTQRPVPPVVVDSARRVDMDVDVLAWPASPVEPEEGVVVSQPLHVFAGHPFGVTLFLPDAPQAMPRIEYATESGTPAAAVLSEAGDDRTWSARITLAEGTYRRTVHVDDRSWSHTVEVEPLLAAYREAAGARMAGPPLR